MIYPNNHIYHHIPYWSHVKREKKKEKKQRKTRQNLEFPELSALAFCMNILSPKNLYFEMAMPYDWRLCRSPAGDSGEGLSTSDDTDRSVILGNKCWWNSHLSLHYLCRNKKNQCVCSIAFNKKYYYY